MLLCFSFIKFDGSLGRWWRITPREYQRGERKGKRALKRRRVEERKQEEALISLLCAYSLILISFCFIYF